jgi:hypothetical protein
MQSVRRAAWYCKPSPTFSDALALVRKELWAHATFRRSPREPDMLKVRRAFVEHLTETLAMRPEWTKSSSTSFDE